MCRASQDAFEDKHLLDAIFRHNFNHILGRSHKHQVILAPDTHNSPEKGVCEATLGFNMLTEQEMLIKCIH